MHDPLTPADFRLMRSLLKHAITAPAQHVRISNFLRESEAIVDALANLERDLRAGVTFRAAKPRDPIPGRPGETCP